MENKKNRPAFRGRDAAMLGGIAGFFAINLAPQIWKCYKTKSTKDISGIFLIFAFGGNIFSAIFVFYTNYQTDSIWNLYSRMNKIFRIMRHSYSKTFIVF